MKPLPPLPNKIPPAPPFGFAAVPSTPLPISGRPKAARKGAFIASLQGVGAGSLGGGVRLGAAGQGLHELLVKCGGLGAQRLKALAVPAKTAAMAADTHRRPRRSQRSSERRPPSWLR